MLDHKRYKMHLSLLEASCYLSKTLKQACGDPTGRGSEDLRSPNNSQYYLTGHLGKSPQK